MGVLCSHGGNFTVVPIWEPLVDTEVRLVGQEQLTEFMKAHADARRPTEAWKAEVEAASWHTQQDVTDRYTTASFLRDRVAVFNIKGNRYRLAAQISFKRGIVRVLRVGTHAEYDTWTL